MSFSTQPELAYARKTVYDSHYRLVESCIVLQNITSAGGQSMAVWKAGGPRQLPAFLTGTE